ncbi:hypothetical protein [Lacticaseibacillus sharpeae]|uniref:hypothetical protein n=1 Tax=Lacticaseibacillus sharpeae TaxID=1626 RepID=UPI000AACD8CF|nr:hypothetical protein [Lacticaseibacillus sharpeae]
MKKNAFFKKALTFISAAVMAGAIGLGAGIGSKVSAADGDGSTTLHRIMAQVIQQLLF